MAPLIVKHDAELSINAPLKAREPFLPFNGHRTFTRFPPVPMSKVKAVRTRHPGCTMNDVAMAALTGALRNYAIEVKGDTALKKGGQPLECKSMVMIALPRKIDERDLTSALCNNILFASCPIPIDEPTPRARLKRTIEGCNDLKSKPYMTGLTGLTKCLAGVAPAMILRKAAGELWSKHTVLVTNVPATTIPVTCPAEGGEVVQGFQVPIPNVMSQVSLVSYNGFIFGNLVADPDLFPDPAALGRYWLAEFDALAA